MSNVENIKKTICKIEEIINELKNKNITDKNVMEDYFWDNHSSIMNSYPFLVCQIISGADKKMLEYMLNTLEKIENGEKDQNDADVEIGQKIVDECVKPKLNNTFDE